MLTLTRVDEEQPLELRLSIYQVPVPEVVKPKFIVVK
jgi:hypothetical protein